MPSLFARLDLLAHRLAGSLRLLLRVKQGARLAHQGRGALAGFVDLLAVAAALIAGQQLRQQPREINMPVVTLLSSCMSFRSSKHRTWFKPASRPCSLD